MSALKLYGTPRSHFTRKVRILLGELELPFELSEPPSLLAATATTYGDNPVLRVPTLVDGDQLVIDSDHIARHIVDRYDPGDRFGVRSAAVADGNRLAVINGIMANEVTLILAKRGGLEDLSVSSYFGKLVAAIEHGLAWLDRETDPDAAGFDYRDIALVCMWQHVGFYQLVGGLEQHQRVAARVARFAARPSVASTVPR
jgi:glutathione S-transferase